MELIVIVLAAFPLGFLIRNRTAAYISFIAVHAYVFTFQSLTLTREWIGGSTEAFAKDPQTVPWTYGLANVLIYAAGLGLVTLGHRTGARRRQKAAASVDLGG